MSRVPHLLSANHRSSTVRHVVFFDTETDQVPVSSNKVVHKLAFGWWCYRRRKPSGEWTKGKWGRFDAAVDFWDTLCALAVPRDRLVAICHNTAFDLSVLDPFRCLPPRGYHLTTACIDAPPTILRWRKGTAILEFLDSLNWWRTSLAKIGERVGLPKLEMPPGWVDRQVADRYCRRDVEILAKAVCGWWDWLQNNDFGGCAPTLASQAMRCYRHRFLDYPIAIDDTDRANALARDAYHGGRVECFRLGKIHGDFTLLDVHSQYPYVMREGTFPVRLIYSVKRCSVKRLFQELTRNAVVAEVTVQTTDPVYPVREGLRLYFPVGEFRACLCTPELELAFERGDVVAVHRVAVYECRPIFRRYIDELYARRKVAQSAGDTVGATQFKDLMNHLYGKFGQRGIFWEEAGAADDLEAEQWAEIDEATGTVTKFRRFGGLVQAQARESESRDSFPAIAAHVTSAARAYLWRLIQRAGREHVLYCDTDSLLVDQIGQGRLAGLTDDVRLGALGEEGRSPCVRLWGAKDYDFGFRARHKGVRKQAVWTGPDTVEQEQWSGLGRALFDEHFHGPTTTRITKRLYRHYDKGVVGPSGIVTPHVLSLA